MKTLIVTVEFHTEPELNPGTPDHLKQVLRSFLAGKGVATEPVHNFKNNIIIKVE